MSEELSEYYRDRNKIAKNKKEKNKRSSTKILEDNDIEFESKNDGYHLIVHYKYRFIDFWPSTGKWVQRNSNHKGNGIRNLLKHLVQVA